MARSGIHWTYSRSGSVEGKIGSPYASQTPDNILEYSGYEGVCREICLNDGLKIEAAFIGEIPYRHISSLVVK
jgi:hypothetical protein